MKTTIQLHGLVDVVTVLPYQLGFHPHSCLVVVSLRGTRMGLVQRIDLPPPQHAGDAVAAMITPLRQDNPKSVLLIGYEEREGESRAMLDEMANTCRAHGIRVADRIVVRGGRWFDVDCTQRCCPPGGLPLPPASAVPAVAEFVGREISPLADRSALADLLEPDRSLPSSHLREVAGLARERLHQRLQTADTVDRLRPSGKGVPAELRAGELALWAVVLSSEDDAQPIRELAPPDLAVLAVSLTDVDLRDALIAWLCPGTLSQDVLDPIIFDQMRQALSVPPWWWDRAGDDTEASAEDHVQDDADPLQVIGEQRIERRLCALSAVLPDQWAVSTLTVLASFAWWRGDGALTRVALDRALKVDPNYRLAQLLEQMVDLAIRPERASA
ncbi:MAG: hypothetical protein QOF35_901 [Actinomycetota bacterium]|nr:hypothetical protein [Actinomycetota bacterium]